MFVTQLSRFFRPQNEQRPPITIQVFLVCALPVFALSTSFTFMLCANINSSENTQTTLNPKFPISDKLDIQFLIKLPIPDQYVSSAIIWLKNDSKPMSQFFGGRNICHERLSIVRCMNKKKSDSCWPKLTKEDMYIMLGFFDNVIFC